MPVTPQKQREIRAARRVIDNWTRDVLGLGHRRPPGGTPVGCYWDPRADEATGVWRKIDTHEVYDPKAREAARGAACRHKKGSRSVRVQRDDVRTQKREQPCLEVESARLRLLHAD